MINWLSVIFNFSWILGLSIALARFSYQSWMRSNQSRNASIATNKYLTALIYLLIGIGLAGTSSTLIERLIWVAMIAITVALTLLSKQQSSENH